MTNRLNTLPDGPLGRPTKPLRPTILESPENLAWAILCVPALGSS